MTVSTTNSRVAQNGDGSSIAFAGPYILAATDLKVYVGGVLKTLTTDYAVSSIGVSNGCLVTFVNPPASGTGNVVFVRDPDQKQETKMPSNDPLPSKSVETALDKLTMLVQRCRDLLSRALVLNDSDISTPASLPTLDQRKNNLLGFDANGNPIAVAPNTQDATSVATLLATRLPSFVGNALRFARVKSDETALEYRTPVQVCGDLGLVIGTNVQAYSANLAGFAAKTAPAGAVVGTSDAQTLTNKTINGGALQTGTAQATTSGTAIDFTGIPSWVRRITVSLNGLSTNGTAHYLLQVGSGSAQSSGYGVAAASIPNGTPSATNSTAGFLIYNADGAAQITSGVLILTLVSGNTWAALGVFAQENATRVYSVAGKVVLSGALDRVRLTTANGTDAFDAGLANILYE